MANPVTLLPPSHPPPVLRIRCCCCCYLLLPAAFEASVSKKLLLFTLRCPIATHVSKISVILDCDLLLISKTPEPEKIYQHLLHFEALEIGRNSGNKISMIEVNERHFGQSWVIFSTATLLILCSERTSLS